MKQSSFEQSGFTLLELLITLAIGAILVGLAVPSFAYAVAKTRADTTATLLMENVLLARSLALNKRKIITLCGTNNNTECNKNASSLLIFEDTNNNHAWDNNELLYRNIATPLGITVLRVSRGADYMRFNNSGYAIEFGSITFCPPENDPTLIRSIIINMAGRPYFALDRNHDKIRENARGENLSC